MTTIVYRDGVLAGDRRTTEGDGSIIWPTKQRKVFKSPNGWLYGAAGSVSEIVQFWDWAKKYAGRKDPSGLPHMDDNFSGILISPRGTVFSLEGGAIWAERCKFFAIGSGMTAALGALHAGATAVQAVKIAQEVDPGSGGGVHYVRLAKNVGN